MIHAPASPEKTFSRVIDAVVVVGDGFGPCNLDP
jgi:hypothetical protein